MAKGIPEVIDLFSGCGGLALGFQKAGFQVTQGIELMKKACDTASYNLSWRFGDRNEHICGDITKMDPSIFADKIGPSGCIVIGGPPCQAYSLAGRSKLRSLGEARVNTNDKRGYLYQDFIRFALGLHARAVVMENVPEATNFGGRNIPQEVSEIFEENGYKAFWTILTSSDFGVPQVRERVIMVAIRNDEGKSVNLPVPTHRNPEGKLTNGKVRSRRFAACCKNFIESKSTDSCSKTWVTVAEAIGDLPVLFPNEYVKYHLLPMNELLPYKSEPSCEFQKQMRTWYGEEMNSSTSHCFRKTLRDYPIFARMQQGDNFSQAAEIADQLLHDACLARGIRPEENPKEYEELKKKIVPPYDRNNFLYKWQKLALDKPSHTLVAHLSVDTYSHIHPVEPRGISVREAARLQSFPDGFVFNCAMSDAFKQIGNAVPPLMAKAVADQLYSVFKEV